MSRLFGTDGVRGIANSELTPELAFNLGKAGAYVLNKEKRKPVVLIGRDTRISGDMLESALCARARGRPALFAADGEDRRGPLSR